jgi:hypothetical protein
LVKPTAPPLQVDASSYVANAKTDPIPPPHTTIHALQLRAFLHASEDVDIDEETIADILDGAGDETEMAEDSADGIDSGEIEDSDEEEDADVTEGDEGQLDISALYLAEQEGKVFAID